MITLFPYQSASPELQNGDKLHNTQSLATVPCKEICFIKSIIIICSHRRSNDQPHTKTCCQINVETQAKKKIKNPSSNPDRACRLFFTGILHSTRCNLMGELEWRHSPGFYLSLSSVIVAGWHGCGSIFGNCHTILMLSSWCYIYSQASSQMLFLLDTVDRQKKHLDPLEFYKMFFTDHQG